jgi:type 1 glutamine amidotransferase
MSTIVVLAGEGEYESDRTMRAVADDLHHELGARVVYRTPDVLEDMPNFPCSTFGGLDDLRNADLMVIYTRFRILPDEEMRRIVDFCGQGGNVLGLRTSTHAFHYAPESPWFAWNEGFGREVLGSPWISHHGHTSATDVTWFSDERHPILAGVPRSFRSPSWLYRSDLQPDCKPILWGTPVDPEDEPTPSPFAWVRERGDQRVVYSNMGHQRDFELDAVRRFLVNAARWCVDEPHADGRAGGLAAEVGGGRAPRSRPARP